MDDTGQVVGPVLEYNDLMLYVSAQSAQAYAPPDQRALATVLYQTPGGTRVALEADPTTLYAPVRGFLEFLYFENDACDGQPWVSSDGTETSLFGQAFVSTPGRMLYVAAPDAATERRVFGSRLTVGGSFGSDLGGALYTNCASGGGFTPMARPMRPVADLDALFTPPFRLLAQAPMTVTP